MDCFMVLDGPFLDVVFLIHGGPIPGSHTGHTIEFFSYGLQSVWSCYDFSTWKLAGHCRREHFICRLFWRTFRNNVIVKRVTSMST